MKFAIFCLAASLAAVCVGVGAGPQPLNQLRKRSVDGTSGQQNPQAGQYPPMYWPPPNYPQPPTTVDPMCPEGKDKACRELPVGQQGSIQVRNDGWVTLQFYVEYKLGNRKELKESRPFTWTIKKTIDIPHDATDIVLTVQGIGLFGVTSDILKKQWKYPVIRCYSSADAQTVTKVGCH